MTAFLVSCYVRGRHLVWIQATTAELSAYPSVISREYQDNTIKQKKITFILFFLLAITSFHLLTQCL